MPDPVIITTWNFGVAAATEGYAQLKAGATALDAIERAANVTELDPAVNSVGYGGLPDADGIVTLDAAIMDGPTHAAGSVAALTDIRTPISVARCVMERTPHVLLAGENARRFALAQGFPIETLLTDESRKKWEKWREEQSAATVAHFDIGPALTTKQGTEEVSHRDTEAQREAEEKEGTGEQNQSKIQNLKSKILTPDDHDTIGLCALDTRGNLAVGCTTSGMAWKLPGRVGDSPIIGSGLYVDNEVGACAGTGYGDEMMKACLAYRVVMLMGDGHTPQDACIAALRYLLRKRPPEQHSHYGAALIALNKAGEVGAAATLSGFSAPDRLWQWAVSPRSGLPSEVTLNEGPYVTSDTIVPSLRS